MAAYYNEIDKYAAAWLRNLISAGHIADGEVDERSIADVLPTELAGFTQCHFFAGVGVWSYALRRAGWPDDRPVWTGSCPCQPFSTAGRGNGFDDERHLWPSLYHLIGQRRPAVFFGEQVASKAVDTWIDLVQDDLEAMGYAVGAIPFPSAGVGAPHIRDRSYFVADAIDDGQRKHGKRLGVASGASEGEASEWERLWADPADGIAVSLMADTHIDGRDQGRVGLAPTRHDGAFRNSPAGDMADPEHGGREGRQSSRRRAGAAVSSGAAGQLADPDITDAAEIDPSNDAFDEQWAKDGRRPVFTPGVGTGGGVRLGRDSSGRAGIGHNSTVAGVDGPGPTNGFWRDPDWLFCRDGKWRPVEPGTSPLAHGAPARVGRLRAYGNAINAEAAAAFIGAYLDR